MSRLRIAFWTALIALVAAAVAITAFRLGGGAASNRPLDIPPGDEEVAYFHTATNAGTWERFVAGIQHAARVQPRFRADVTEAFPDQSTATPQVILSLEGSDRRLLIRWYKQSAQMRVEDWVREMAKRDRPPLAVVGGGSSDRALELARVMAQETGWRGRAPLLFITTATASTLQVSDTEQFELMRVYPNRTYRFCFTNEQMARAVVDFVWSRPELRPMGPPLGSLASIGNGAGGPWAALAPLQASLDEPGNVYSVEWRDDPYSVDLARGFREVLFDQEADADFDSLRPWLGRVASHSPRLINSSVAGFLRPNASEAEAITSLIAHDRFLQRPIPTGPMHRSLLILPTVPPPARRILAGLTGAVPGIGRHLVAMSGDGIAFNHVYRDGPLIWNARLVPVPLVFFTHQNPVAWDKTPPAGEPFRLDPPNGTDDVLHFAEVVRLLAEAAFDVPPLGAGAGLTSDSDELARRMVDRDPAYFDPDGNRRGGRGEYVIYLRPRISQDSAIPSATLEVWSNPDGVGWQRVCEPLDIKYR